MADDFAAPLEGLLVLDMGLFLAGPWAALRLQDLGARVIKIERPDGGDPSRRLYPGVCPPEGDSLVFQAINRGKESLVLDLKDAADREAMRKLVARADVLVHNFRPGVAERLGFGPDVLRELNPRLVEATVSGYGSRGPWASLPGQDLLVQARSGLTWINGYEGDGPVPVGLAVVDMFAGAALAQGILAALVRRGITGRGARVETSLLEAAVDLQFEALTTWLNSGREPPRRAGYRNAHVYLGAPYGIYPTRDSWLALAMNPLDRLNAVLGIPDLGPFVGAPERCFRERDTVARLIAARLGEETTATWLERMQAAGIWCAEVRDWEGLLASGVPDALGLLQEIGASDGRRLATTRCPLRFDGARARTQRPAPRLGEHSAAIRAEFGL